MVDIEALLKDVNPPYLNGNQAILYTILVLTGIIKSWEQQSTDF